MIHSMTAFARRTLQNEHGLMTLELKSVNHRFSEISLRLPEELRSIDNKIREIVGKSIKRGKIDCSFRYRSPELVETNIELDQVLLEKLLDTSKILGDKLPTCAPINVLDLMKWPGVLRSPEQDGGTLAQQAMEMLDVALKELQDTRAREGEQIKKLITDRCTLMLTQVKQVKARMPEIIDNMRRRLREKLEAFKVELDEARLEQEMIYLINKSDVAEEMDRLLTHITEVERVLVKGGPVGRRLDFLMQELNREANTLGSKSVDTETTKSAVELKVLIEQIREQIQNLQ